MNDIETLLAEADETTCYDAMRAFMGECHRGSSRERLIINDVISLAQNIRCPALLIGVVAALVPDGTIMLTVDVSPDGSGWANLNTRSGSLYVAHKVAPCAAALAVWRAKKEMKGG